jgi:hypothetical protein
MYAYHHIGDTKIVEGTELVVVCVHSSDCNKTSVYYDDGSILISQLLTPLGAREEKFYRISH